MGFPMFSYSYIQTVVGWEWDFWTINSMLITNGIILETWGIFFEMKRIEIKSYTMKSRINPVKSVSAMISMNRTEFC